ncbi:MAG: holo-ACP synthase [Halanaerobiales bacterium]
MIKGLGVDLVEIRRIEGIIKKSGDRFLEKIFTPDEIEYCQNKGASYQHFAARFAAKEAVVKMLGDSSGISWQDIEVFNQNNGAPEIRLTGQAGITAEKYGINSIHISISHEKKMAVAMVIGEGD